MKTEFDICTIFNMPFPAMSVYDFYQYVKGNEVRSYWDQSTIYFICQRAVIYFDELTVGEASVSAKIKQRGTSKEIDIELPLCKGSDLNPEGDSLTVDVRFYSVTHEEVPPFNNVAGFQLFDKDKNFIVWFTPERLIYDHVIRGLNVKFNGDFHQFLDYNVHYIGQAQDQKIWERLKNHETLQRIIATEHPYINGEYSSYEFVLIFLQNIGADIINYILPEESDFVSDSSKTKFIEDLSNLEQEQILDKIKKEITNDIEAYLVNLFEPKQNKILFKNYPNITNGLKSLGYNNITHEFMVLGDLHTEEGSYFIKTAPIYINKSDQ